VAHHPYRAAIRAYALISPAGACFIEGVGSHDTARGASNPHQK
jgi:hypothetical protein